MTLIWVMLKDLRLVARDRSAVVQLLLVPLVVIFFVAESQSRDRETQGLLFPVVNEDQGPVANAILRVLREHGTVREVTLSEGEKLVRDENRAPAVLVLPEGMSKRYLTEKPSQLHLLTDPAQWAGLQAVKVILLLADREAASLGDPFHEELLTIEEKSLTGARLRFSSVEQNVPGFSVMFVLLTLVYGVAFGLRDEEAWATSTRLSIAPVRPEVILGGKVLARGVVASIQLVLLLVFGRVAYGISLGRPAVLLGVVAPVIAFSVAGFSVVVAAMARTKEQILPVGLAAVFVLASLGGCFWPYGELPHWMQTAAHAAITTWSMFSLLDVMLRERGLVDVLPELGVLAAYGLAAFLVSTRFFRYAEA